MTSPPLRLHFDVPLSAWPPPNPVVLGDDYWVIYARISADPSNTKEGVRRQTIEAERKIRERGWIGPILLRMDNDISAISGKARPAFEEILGADFPSGRLAGLAVFAVDRLYRRLEDLSRIVTAFETHPTPILTVTSSDLDLSTPSGRLVARLLASVAQHEVELIQVRLRAYHMQAALDGKQNGKPGFGYGPGMVVIPEQAEVIRRIADEILERGTPLSRIAQSLNEQGIKTEDAGRMRRNRKTGELAPVSGLWTASNLGKFIVRPRLAGIRMHRGKIAAEAAWEPILDLATHRRLVHLFRDPDRQRFARGGARRYLLTGIAICGRCREEGKTVYLTGRHKPASRSQKETWVYICIKERGGCSRLVRAQLLVDAFVEEQLLGHLSAKNVRPQLSKVPLEVDALLTRRQELEQMAQEYNEDRLAFKITRSQFLDATANITQQMEEVDQQIAAAVHGDRLAALAGADVAERWRAMTMDERHAVARDAIREVVILPAARRGAPFDPGRLQIVWR